VGASSTTRPPRFRSRRGNPPRVLD
jgi:hypothetical protein